MNASDNILKIFKSSPLPLKSDDIADKSGIDKKEVDKLLKKLITEGVIVSPKRCFYELKK